MSYELRIRVLAQNDIQEIVDYYDKTSTKITDVFLWSLYAELDRITENPFLFQEKYKGTRVYYLKNFSFGIHYQIQFKIVEVLAVLHTSKNPNIWWKH